MPNEEASTRNIRLRSLRDIPKTLNKATSLILSIKEIVKVLNVPKIATAKAMAVLCDERAVPALARLTREKNADLADAAKVALTRIGGTT